ncbi:hypothetical protein GOD47_09070 [Sinorhizobium medicae]|nr:hypothetical protein [Sinorhizobium medicae]MDX0725199.1 hypothetical protein [Sinorhizobium medicae]MDX0731185.1 hypothetical protein [Sinorhizobium medicae]MDX0811426.1 hypothetical protein [Sinorhizobium medicae]RVO80486.1 hypothetical protein CN084_08660 [Sinorhizobium medicae]
MNACSAADRVLELANRRSLHMPERRRPPKDPLSELAAREEALYLRRSSTRFLECAIHLCVTHMTLQEVADLLEKEAAQLRRFG